MSRCPFLCTLPSCQKEIAQNRVNRHREHFHLLKFSFYCLKCSTERLVFNSDEPSNVSNHLKLVHKNIRPEEFVEQFEYTVSEIANVPASNPILFANKLFSLASFPAPIAKILNDALVSLSTCERQIKSAFKHFRQIYPEDISDNRGVYFKFNLNYLKVCRLSNPNLEFTDAILLSSLRRGYIGCSVDVKRREKQHMAATSQCLNVQIFLPDADAVELFIEYLIIKLMNLDNLENNSSNGVGYFLPQFTCEEHVYLACHFLLEALSVARSTASEKLAFDLDETPASSQDTSYSFASVPKFESVNVLSQQTTRFTDCRPNSTVTVCGLLLTTPTPNKCFTFRLFDESGSGLIRVIFEKYGNLMHRFKEGTRYLIVDAKVSKYKNQLRFDVNSLDQIKFVSVRYKTED